MPIFYKIQQGDYLSQISLKHGFSDPETIWSHPQNASLKQKRKSPHILLPGDVLFIPDKAQKQHSGATTKQHDFQIGQKTVKLRIALKDWDGEPFANLPCLLKIGPHVTELTTDGEGMIEMEIPVTVTEGKLVVPELNQEIPIKIGHLDPSEEEVGWKERLHNLGYLTGTEEPDEATLKCALEEFQCNTGLTVDGVCGPQTLSQLEDSHGC